MLWHGCDTLLEVMCVYIYDGYVQALDFGVKRWGTFGERGALLLTIIIIIIIIVLIIIVQFLTFCQVTV